MSSSKTNWLTMLSSTLNFSPSFLKIFNEKLVEHTKSLTGIELCNGEYVLLPHDSEFEVQYKQVDSLTIASIEGDLIGPDGMGHPVTAIWYCPNFPHNQIDPANQLPENINIEVYWVEFPIDEFDAYSKPTLPPIEISTELNFVVEWRMLIWPDINLELQAQDGYTKTQIVQIENAIDRTIFDFNEQQDNQGKVHYRSDILPINNNCLKIHIDFGSANKNIVQLLLQNLSNIAKPNFLTKVILH